MSIATRLGPHTTVDLDRLLSIERVETRWFDKEDGWRARLVDHVRGVRPSAKGNFDPAVRWHLGLTSLEGLGASTLVDLATVEGLSGIRKLTLDLTTNHSMQGMAALLAAPGMAGLEWLALGYSLDVRRETPPDGAALVDALRGTAIRLRALECGGFTWDETSCGAFHHVDALSSLECLSLAACRFAGDSLCALFPASSPMRLRELSISDTEISNAVIDRLCDSAVVADVEDLAIEDARLTIHQRRRLGERFGGRLRAMFTTFEHQDAEYVLGRTSRKSFLPEYAARKSEWRCELTEYANASFIPCPYCNDRATRFTFRFSSEEGTNTSGGTEYTEYEVHCGRCGAFSMFTRTETHGPGG